MRHIFNLEKGSLLGGKSTPDESLKPHLKGSEDGGSRSEDAIHAVSHVESVRPVVVRNSSVIPLHGQCEPSHGFHVEAGSTEEIEEHADGHFRLLRVFFPTGREKIAGNTNEISRNGIRIVTAELP